LERDLSDQEEMVQRSDSEKEDSNMGSSDTTALSNLKSEISNHDSDVNSKRKESASSFFSSPSSSSEAEYEGNECDEKEGTSENDLQDEHNQKTRHQRKKKIKKRCRGVLRDNENVDLRNMFSESDEYRKNDIAKRTKKSNIYSDTDEDTKLN